MSKYKKLLGSLNCEWLLPSSANDDASMPEEVLCGATYSSMDTFHAHVRSHLTEAVGCGVCGWVGCGHSSADMKELTQHVLFHPYHSFLKLLGKEVQVGRKLPNCQLGDETLNNVPMVDMDLRCVWDDGQCCSEFECVGEFYHHVHEHVMGNSDLECKWKGCSFSGRDKFKVLEHTRSHMQEKVVACPTCGSLFSNNTKLRDHLSRQIEPSDPTLTCSFCQKCFPNERLLREHARRHVNTIKCPHCDLTCNSPSRLLQHIRFRHMESKPHSCPLCSRGFKTSYALTEHMESHRQQKLYRCTFRGCKYSSRTLKSWQQHMKSTHMPEERLYCCHICSCRFSIGMQLSAHLKESHGFELPPGHCRFRYVVGADGLKRLQTVRLDDENILTPQVDLLGTSDLSEALQQHTASKEMDSVEEEEGYLVPEEEDVADEFI